MDNTQNSCYTRRKRVPFEELTLADDFLFCKVMQNKRLCKELLEIILRVKIDKIEYSESQKVFDEWGEEVQQMCNLSQGIEEKGIRKGIEKQKHDTASFINKMQEKGWPAEKILASLSDIKSKQN